MQAANRKASYKLPPTTIRDKLISQETRRNKALEDQKRRRAQRVDSFRQLDLFADLTLGISEGEEDEDRDDGATSNITPASVAPYASMLDNDTVPNAITSHEQSLSVVIPQQNEVKRKSKKKANKKRSNKPSKWADKCMYAELLEMSADEPWYSQNSGTNDGLPRDLETGWVAVAPVPAGKRCLAVSHQSSGVAGIVPNTTLRSRLLGKTLINRFPSNLPPLTILDCILDANWRENGILHVLDVVKWKGQDVGDCEAPFRFWWRDTRLTELSRTLPPPANLAQTADPNTKYRFPYPTTLIPIPYHTNTSLFALDTQIIPLAREERIVSVDVPIISPAENGNGHNMDIESTHGPPSTLFTFQAPSLASPQSPQHAIMHVSTASVLAPVQPDGLLLYVSQASYEPGTSPLSSWIPIIGYDGDAADRPDTPNLGTGMFVHAIESTKEGPLDMFQRLVKGRLRNQATPATSLGLDIEME